MKKKILEFEKYLINLDVKKIIFLFFLVITIKVGFWYHPALAALSELHGA